VSNGRSVGADAIVTRDDRQALRIVAQGGRRCHLRRTLPAPIIA
jgi:hypothetical protein